MKGGLHLRRLAGSLVEGILGLRLLDGARVQWYSAPDNLRGELALVFFGKSVECLEQPYHFVAHILTLQFHGAAINPAARAAAGPRCDARRPASSRSRRGGCPRLAARPQSTARLPSTSDGPPSM